jgi:ElaB/YqjD/DUF883 family membrane-anchored ribosome-binding protein
METTERTDFTQKAEDLKNKAQGAVQDWTEKAKGSARDATAAADLYVHQYAWTSVAVIAVFAGVLGFLLGSRRGD